MWLRARGSQGSARGRLDVTHEQEGLHTHLHFTAMALSLLGAICTLGIQEDSMREALGDDLFDDVNAAIAKCNGTKVLPLQPPLAGEGTKRVTAYGLATYGDDSTTAVPNCLAPMHESPKSKTTYLEKQIDEYIPNGHPMISTLRKIVELRTETDFLDTLDGAEKGWVPIFSDVVTDFNRILNYPQHTTVNQMTMLGAACLDAIGSKFRVEQRLMDRTRSLPEEGFDHNVRLIAIAAIALAQALHELFVKVLIVKDEYKVPNRSNSLDVAMSDVNEDNFETQMFDSLLKAQIAIMKRRVLRTLVSMDSISKNYMKTAFAAAEEDAQAADARRTYVEHYCPLSEEEIVKALAHSRPKPDESSGRKRAHAEIGEAHEVPEVDDVD